MEYKTIPEMNRQLDQLNQFFTNRTQYFKKKISQHEGKFTNDDLDGFENLVEEIKRDALTKISNIFSEKFSDRSAIYETQISSYTSDGNSVKDDLDKSREQLIAATLTMKEEQNRKQALMEFFSEKFRKNQILKKSFKLMRENKLKRKEARTLDEKMDVLYRKNLLKKSFFPWRYLTYKDGFANTVQKQAENDIINIHEQYNNIIEILKTKITETDQIIRVKKAAKGQFAYALSKNLLKTISNLSLQVMNLNQMSLRDGEWVEESTERFMNEVDSVIQGKLMKVREYKRELIDREGKEDQGQKKKKHISFDILINFIEILSSNSLFQKSKYFNVDCVTNIINFIMSTQTNSFKLQRLTKTVGVREQSFSEYSPKDTFKLAALNSINRSIKYNDLSFASGRTDLNKLRKEPQVGEDLQFESAHHNLDSIRKNFDSVHKQKVKREVNISRLKDEKKKFEIVEGELLDGKKSGNKKVEDLENQKQRIKFLLSQTQIQKKVLLNMRDRLKKDKVVYDQRKFNLQKQFRFLKTQLEAFSRDGTEILEADDRSNKVYKKYIQQINVERFERESHLNSLEYMIEEKRRINQLNEVRERQMMDIAERALQDKDGSEKSWEKLYLTNKFLAKMLRDKMDKEMTKFFMVESAFKNIKISTGVSDAEALVSKFLNKQSAYGDLLGKIAENQKKIESLKLETQQLIQEHKELEAEKQILVHTKVEIPSLQKQNKKLDEITEKRKKTGLLKEKLRNWILKNVKKINLVLGTQHDFQIQRNQKSMTEAFVKYLELLAIQAVNSEKLEANFEKFDSNEKLSQRKTLRIRRDSEKFDESEEEATAQNEEDDLISGQRNEIHRQNQKFMKELRKKNEEKRKLKAQALQPKKVQKAPEKPKEQQQS